MPSISFKATDRGGAQASVLVDCVTAQPPPPSDAPARDRTITGQSGLVAQNDTRYIDCPGLSLPSAGLSRCTIIGSEFPQTTVLRGVQDVWIEGRPDAYMNRGPRSDGGDLLQIKVNPSGYVPTDRLTMRWIRFHDATRPSGSSAHTDAIQIMAMTNSRLVDLEVLDNFQGILVSTNLDGAGGFGRITNNVFEGIRFRYNSANGSPWAANFTAGPGGGAISGNTLKDLVTLGGSILVHNALNSYTVINSPDVKYVA